MAEEHKGNAVEEKAQDKAVELKTKGNEAFKDGKWEEAINLFSSAIALDPANAVFWSNRSAAFLSHGQYAKALEDALQTISLKNEWSKGYQRQGTALLHLQRPQEAQNAFQRALALEPSSQELKQALARAVISSKVSAAIPKGIWAQVPIAYSPEKPNPIAWDVVDAMCDVLIDRGCTALWALSPASEVQQLSDSECDQFVQRVVARCKPRNVAVIAGVKPNKDQHQLAENIKKVYTAGASAVVIGLSDIAGPSESVTEENFKNLLAGGEIPIGICESSERLFTPELLKKLLNTEKFYFYIDKSGSPGAMRQKISVCDTTWFRPFVGSATAFGTGMNLGFVGYAGEASTLLPKLFVWLYNHYSKPSEDEDKDESNETLASGVEAFLSISEPTVKNFFPINLKIFLKLHESQLKNLEAVSRVDVSSGATEENVTRITHFHEAAEFAEKSLLESGEKR